MLLNRRLGGGKTAVFMSKADYLDCVPPVLISLSIWRAPPELSLKTTCLNFIYCFLTRHCQGILVRLCLSFGQRILSQKMVLRGTHASVFKQKSN